MAHQPDSTVVEAVVQLLCENGLESMAEAVRILLNEAMKVERSQALGAGAYERSEVDFYPSALERGVRSERALKLAIAEMYVHGVSTRKVTQVMEELCGLEVSSTQVSRASQLLDEELATWRNRPLGPFPYIQIFRGQTGYTPKVFCRIRRFQKALDCIEASGTVDWSAVALDSGYFDQAHFNHDFRAFSGINPSTYLVHRTPLRNHVPLPD